MESKTSKGMMLLPYPTLFVGILTEVRLVAAFIVLAAERICDSSGKNELGT